MEVSRKYKEVNDYLQCHLNILIEILSDRQFGNTDTISSELIFLTNRLIKLSTREEWHKESRNEEHWFN